MLQAERQRSKDMGQELQVLYIKQCLLIYDVLLENLEKNRQRQLLCTSFFKAQRIHLTCSNDFCAYSQGTLEKLDIQTETNNKLLAQQDKQQVSCTELNCKRCCSVVLTCVDCISGHGQSTGTTGGPQNWTTREQLHMRATGTRLRRMPLWSVNLVSFQTINEFNALNSYRLRKSTLYQKNSMNQRPP